MFGMINLGEYPPDVSSSHATCEKPLTDQQETEHRILTKGFCTASGPRILMTADNRALAAGSVCFNFLRLIVYTLTTITTG